MDIKEPEYEPTCAHEFELLDLTKWENCLEATRGVDRVYGLAANMGGIGFIESRYGWESFTWSASAGTTPDFGLDTPASALARVKTYQAPGCPRSQ